MFSDLQGRNAVVFGVANKRSIAWSIAQRLHATGVKLAVTYQNERLEQEAKDLILSLPGAEAYMCDVSKDEDIDRLFATLKQRHGKLHALVHSVAYAPADELKGDLAKEETFIKYPLLKPYRAQLERLVRILDLLEDIRRQRQAFGRRLRAQEERPPVDRQLVLLAQLLDLDQTDVAPRSDEIGPDLDALHGGRTVSP